MKYEKPELDIVVFNDVDIIRTSVPEAGDDVLEDNVGWG